MNTSIISRMIRRFENLGRLKNIPSGFLLSHQSQLKRNYSKYEPPYLKEMEPDIPVYNLLNVQLKGFDFPVLEKFAKYVHRTAKRMDIDVRDSWGLPAKNLKITRLKEESTIVDSEYNLKLYERNVQLSEVSTTSLPIFLHIVELTLPAGISMCIQPHLPELTELRYIPDLQLNELKVELEAFTKEREKK